MTIAAVVALGLMSLTVAAPRAAQAAEVGSRTPSSTQPSATSTTTRPAAAAPAPGPAPATYPPNLSPSPALPHSPAFLEQASKAAQTRPATPGVGPAISGSAGAQAVGAAQGVDVASFQHNQGPIDWATVASDKQFAYVKATEGNYYVNPYYFSDAFAALGDGMYVGGYEFATPNDTSGQAEADYFLSQTNYGFASHIILPMVDLENDPYNSSTPCYGLSPAGMVAWIAAYSAEIRAHLGRPPVIYTGAGWWNQCTGGSAAFNGNPLWIASYGVSSPGLPAGFPTWAIWQYAVGTTAGITGPADLDEFNGTVAALAAQLTQTGSASGPADASPGAGRLDVFYRGTDGGVWDRTSVNGSVSVSSLGGGVEPGTGPAAVSWSPGRLDVFVEGADQQLYHNAWNGSGWSGWEALGGVLTSSPTVASWAPGRLDVFVAGSDGSVWHLWWNSPSWSAWEGMGGSVLPGTGPSAVSWSSGRIDLFLTGIDSKLWHRGYAGGWAGWEPLGGALTTSPGVASWAPGRLDIFAAGTDEQMWHLWWGGSWGFWQPLGGVLASAPGATSEGAGLLEVVVRGSDSKIWEDDYNSGWSGFVSLGQTIG